MSKFFVGLMANDLLYTVKQSEYPTKEDFLQALKEYGVVDGENLPDSDVIASTKEIYGRWCVGSGCMIPDDVDIHFHVMDGPGKGHWKGWQMDFYIKPFDRIPMPWDGPVILDEAMSLMPGSYATRDRAFDRFMRSTVQDHTTEPKND